MSTCPGYDLEDFVLWNLDLIVDGRHDANPSLMIAETLGVKTRRITITEQQFQAILALYEPYRERVEYMLGEYDNADQSWRDYAGYAFDFLPKELGKDALSPAPLTGGLTCAPSQAPAPQDG